MAESLFVTKCRGCEERYAELATDDMLKRRFRQVEANKAPHSAEGARFIREHTNNCPEYARKKAEYWAKKEQEKAEARKAAQKPKQKPVPAALAKQNRDAVDKHRRSEKQSGEAIAPASSVKNGNRLVEILADGPEQQDATPGRQDTISAPPVGHDAATADAAPQLPQLGTTEIGTASRDNETKESVKYFLRQVLYAEALRMRGDRR